MPASLDEEGAEVAVLAEPEMLVEGRSMPQSTMPVPITVPGGYPVRGEPSGQRSSRRSMSDQDQVDGEVLQRLEDRDREPPAGLSGVVHAEPLVGRDGRRRPP